ncbi:hypothetical protein [Sporomusa malonica]|uniref:Uncharacterized protein n=1 Tax=Sporomusa malonica TaxID=112901 RepID=A0A1W1Z706_9FIRM|nr:hypothetical protein [Sporomusa malonica]SMC44164.1 hypothetical protein SAMN04488500_10345 [Sporomusa malonica]
MAISGMSGMSGMHGAHHGQQATKTAANSKATVQESPVATDLAKSVEPHKGHAVDISA